MKTVILIAMCAMAACAVDQTSTTEQGLICNPWCDPTDTNYLQQEATRFGESLFYDSVATGWYSCNTGPDGEIPDNLVCSAGFQTCSGAGGRCFQYIAWCDATRCDWY